MITQLPADEIAEQQRLLGTYRHTLAIYLRQAAELGGDAYCPPALLNGVDETRRNIAHLKATLRSAGADVADDPDDEAADDWAAPAQARPAARPIDARRSAQPPRPWTVLAGAGLVAVALLVLLVRWLAVAGAVLPLATPTPTPQIFKVSGAAMEPTFAMGQVVTITPFGSAALERGAVVLVAPFGKQSFLKRVVGMPGDTVGIHDGRVYIDGVSLDEPYVRGAATTCRPEDPCGEGKSIKVLAGSVFVLGDNRMNSSDSREFGPVPISQIKGWVR